MRKMNSVSLVAEKRSDFTGLAGPNSKPPVLRVLWLRFFPLPSARFTGVVLT
jgi:hypothetical protein